MGTIAEKLTYLNTTKTMLKDSLNKFGSSILSTDTFRSYDTKLNEIYDKLPKVTQSGAGFTLSDVQNGQVDDFKMVGTDLEQDTTTGKNLLNISDITSGNGIKNNNNKSITLNGNITSTSFTLTNPITLKANATYIMSLTNNDTNAGDSTFILRNGNTNKMSIYFKNLVSNAPFTPTEDIIIDTLRIYNSGVTFNNYTFSIQLEEGSSSTSFEPYTGGIPSPNPDYPQEIKVVEGRQVITDKGKNLFDKNNVTLGYRLTTEGRGTPENDYYVAQFIKVKPNTIYTKNSPIEDAYHRFAFYSSNSTDDFISVSNSNTVTTPSNCNYIRFCGLQNELNETQLEEGSTATDYEPYYNPVSYNIDLHGKNIFDGQYEDGYYNMNGTKSSTQDPYGRRSTNLNEIKPNTNYIISINNNIISETIRLFYYDASRKFISTESISNGTFTSPAECYYVSWHSSSLKQNYPDGIPNMMIEQGQTVTTYEDYYDYKLAKIPNTDYKNKTYKSNGNWYFEEKVKKIVIDEKTSTPSIVSSSNNTIRLLYSRLLSNNKSIADNPDIVSNYLTGKIMWSIDSEGIYSNNNDLVMRMNKSTVGNTLNSVLDWLSTHNVEIWYPLATPVTTQITNATLINQLEAISVHTGTNIITISNDNNIIPEIEITRLKELEKLA